MASNITKDESQGAEKSDLDSILECTQCRKRLNGLPETLHECLHSFCPQCLHSLPQTEQEGCKGWICPQCNSFSSQDKLRHNDFIQDLLQMTTTSKTGADEAKSVVTCKQCLTKDKVTKKCVECKIELCVKCQAGHLRIPMLQDHKMADIKSQEETIDKVIYCDVHPQKLAKYNCKTCNIQICSNCNLTNHNSHSIETASQAVGRLLPEMETSAKTVAENLIKIQSQIAAETVKIEETRELYSAVRMEMDEHVEKIINRIKAKKMEKEEQINEQETNALAYPP